MPKLVRPRLPGLIILTLVLASLSFFMACDADDGSPPLDEALQAQGFSVRAGSLAVVDIMGLCCSPQPKVASCWGNNVNAPYLAAWLPDAPDQDPLVRNSLYNKAGQASSFRLRADEAVILVGNTPPKLAYFSFTPYLVMRSLPGGSGQTRTRLFNSLTDSFNNARMSTAGTPNGQAGNPYGQRFAAIYAADGAVAAKARQAVLAAGYPAEIVNMGVFPPQLLNLGLGQDADELTVVLRLAQPEDQAALDLFMAAPEVQVYRATPATASPARPYATPGLIARSTGVQETALVPSVDLKAAMTELRAAILTSNPGKTVTEPDTGIWLYDGRTCTDMGIDCLADSRDTLYLRAPANSGPATDAPTGPAYLTLKADEYVIVYGVNHAATGKTTYSSFNLYDQQKMLGVAGSVSKQYAGSAEPYLQNATKSRYLYAWKLARSCNGDPYCTEVPSGSCATGAPGAPLDSNVLICFRNYLSPATGIGPDFGEIVPDRILHFKP